MNPQNKTFEESMARLEQIVRAMERGDVALEESLKLFQEGTELVKLPEAAGRRPASGEEDHDRPGRQPRRGGLSG